MICRHCGQQRGYLRPLGLCWACWFTPGLREMYGWRKPATESAEPQKSESKMSDNVKPVARKRVYIAFPISKGDLAANINQGTAAFVALAKAGFAPFNPAWSCYAKEAIGYHDPVSDTHKVYCYATALGSPEMSHADWMGIDLPWVEAADAVLRLPGESVGADPEVGHAIEHGIPVYFALDALIERFAEKAAEAKGAA